MERLGKIALICSLMIAIILFSGCTAEDLPIGGELCTKIGICEKKVIEEKPEVILIKEIKVLPSAEVKANELVDIYVTIKNKDPEKEIKGVNATISNPGDFECLNCSFILTMHPLQEKTLHFKLRAPDFKGTMHVPETLTFTVTFDYDSHTTKSIWLIGKNTYREYLESGRKVPITLSESKSKGPVRIDLEVDAEQPIAVDLERKKVNLYLQMNNVMDGIVYEFKSLNLSVSCPEVKIHGAYEVALAFADWDNETFASEGSFKLVLSDKGKKEIAFYGKSSPKYSFVLNACGYEDSDVFQCTISADAEYTYKISRNFEVVVEGSGK